MLRDPPPKREDIYPAEAYMDPSLVRNRKAYCRFVRALRSRGLVEPVLRCREEIGAVAVWKDAKKRQRLIVDARRPNRVPSSSPYGDGWFSQLGVD